MQLITYFEASEGRVIYRVDGDWMQDGYRADLAPNFTLVEIVGSRLYDVDDYGHRLARVDVTAEGNWLAWGSGVAFSPDESEVRALRAIGVSA